MSEWAFTKGTITGDFLPKLVPHHRQGTLDGACGFYCLSMILDYFELCDPSHDIQDGRTRLSRYLRQLGRNDLLNKGLSEIEIHRVARFFTPRRIKSDFGPASGFGAIKKWVQGQCGQGIPAILMFQPKDGPCHYAVTVGTGADKIFLIDPAFDAPEGTLYNRWLRFQRRGVIWDNFGQRIENVGPCSAVYPEGIDIGDVWWLPR